MTTVNLGRQYDGLPFAAALLFAGVFATLHHVGWLAAGGILASAVLAATTRFVVSSEQVEVCRRFGGVSFRCRAWPMAAVKGAVLTEHRDATTYTSHSIRNTVRVHSFVLTLRVQQGSTVRDVEVYEFTQKSQADEVLEALGHHTLVAR